MIDVTRIRNDFPVLSEKRNGKPIIYADSACMSLKPRSVIAAIVDYYEHYTACGGRSPHKFSRETTQKYEQAREKIAKFIHANPKEIIWTKNTTEGINIVRNGIHWNKGDTIISDDVSHNSNLVPWMYLKSIIDVKQKFVNIPLDGHYPEEQFISELDKTVKLVTLTHTSNVTGVTANAKKIIKLAHDNGSLVVLDAAQSFPHQAIDVHDLDVDFLAASIHKACGPSIGILYGKYELLESLGKFIVGGETVVNVSLEDGPEFAQPPAKFEAGLQNYADAIGAGVAIDYLVNLGMDNIHSYEKRLSSILTHGIKELESYGVHLIGPLEKDAALAAVYVDNIDPHDIAIMLDDEYNIFLRSGKHCTHSFHNKFHISSSLRPSWYLYNTEEEVKLFIEHFEEVLKIFSG